VCNTLDTCPMLQTTEQRVPNAVCGSFASYQAMLRNACGQTIACRACWWTPSENAYATCTSLGEIQSNGAVPVGVVQCANAAFPDPPVKIRCVDDYTFHGSFDCLGTGPL
jgi:hypothetical protein